MSRMNEPTRRFATTLARTIAATMAMATTAGAVNGINNNMPNRISMNVTVGKQTQGATFGEKVQAGLQSAGNAVASGASLTIECGTAACVVALPDGSGYRADLRSMKLAPLDAAQGLAVRKAGGSAALLGGALPGGAIISAAVSSVSALAGGGDVSDPLGTGDYALTLVVDTGPGGSKDTLQTQVRAAAAQRIRMRLVFSAANGALRARQDSSENAIAVAP